MCEFTRNRQAVLEIFRTIACSIADGIKKEENISMRMTRNAKNARNELRDFENIREFYVFQGYGPACVAY